jgi:hypothetical protein
MLHVAATNFLEYVKDVDVLEQEDKHVCPKNRLF